jgi:hypothetical protein
MLIRPWMRQGYVCLSTLGIEPPSFYERVWRRGGLSRASIDQNRMSRKSGGNPR